MTTKLPNGLKPVLAAGAALLAVTAAARADYVLYQDPAFPSIIYIDAGEPKQKPRQVSFGGAAQDSGTVTVNGEVQAKDGVPVDASGNPVAATGPDAAAQGQNADQQQSFEERTQETIEVIETGDPQGVAERAADTAVTAPMLDGATLR